MNAVRFRKDMLHYERNSYLSAFTTLNIIPIGRGGMILTDKARRLLTGFRAIWFDGRENAGKS
jgi:hypothetical protein